MTEKKKQAVGTNWVVSVFDDRVPLLAKCSKKIKVKAGTPLDKIASVATSEVYGSEEEFKVHCTRVQVYAADITFRVVDGDKFTLIAYRKEDEQEQEVPGLFPTPEQVIKDLVSESWGGNDHDR